jgi:hypothetical protein
MKLFAAGSVLCLLLSACASQGPVETARSLPETPDPAGAKKLSGEWVFAMKVGDRDVDGKLHFSYDGASVAGSFMATGGESIELADIRVSKNEVAWTIPGERGTEVLTGAFASDGTLSGKMSFERKPGGGEPPNDGGSAGEGRGADGQAPGGYGSGGGRHGHHGGAGGAHRGGGSRTGTWTALPAPKDSEHDSEKPSSAANRLLLPSDRRSA